MTNWTDKLKGWVTNFTAMVEGPAPTIPEMMPWLDLVELPPIIICMPVRGRIDGSELEAAARAYDPRALAAPVVYSEGVNPVDPIMGTHETGEANPPLAYIDRLYYEAPCLWARAWGIRDGGAMDRFSAVVERGVVNRSIRIRREPGEAPEVLHVAALPAYTPGVRGMPPMQPLNLTGISGEDIYLSDIESEDGMNKEMLDALLAAMASANQPILAALGEIKTMLADMGKAEAAEPPETAAAEPAAALTDAGKETLFAEFAERLVVSNAKAARIGELRGRIEAARDSGRLIPADATPLLESLTADAPEAVLSIVAATAARFPAAPIVAPREAEQESLTTFGNLPISEYLVKAKGVNA